jgi:dihydrofolate synthase/folylpolyglutamate synthase
LNNFRLLSLLAERGNEVHGMHLGLHRIAAIMEALDNPHERYPVLHIAGTNGKGSVAAMSESILRAAGRKTGLYTSPHLERLQERIRVRGRDIPIQKFVAVAKRILCREDELVASRALDIRLTFFEFLTACAFLHFAEEEVDVAVIEVGLGGRLDATNVVHPQACIITGISYDHQDLLGGTLEKIAREKAGIIKARTPVISGCRAPEARRVIRTRARRLGAPLTEIDRDFLIRVTAERGPFFTIDLQTPKRLIPRLTLSLAGSHQVRNAAMAVAGVEAIESLAVTDAQIRRGLARTRWQGRLDEYRAKRRTLLEGAHNPEGAQALRDYLARYEKDEIHLVFGALQDKDIEEIGRQLFPLAQSIHLTPVANSRTAEPAMIAAKQPRFRGKMKIHPNAVTALRAAWKACPPRGLVVVTGSLYLVGELLPLVRSKTRNPS